MDAYEATRIVFSRIQSLDPENAAKIMGLLLIQDHGEKEMIRLAFGPEALLHSVVLKARKELGLLPPSSPAAPSGAGAAATSPFLLGQQNSSSRLLGGGGGGVATPLAVGSPTSWAPLPVFSRSSSLINGAVNHVQSSEELVSPSNPATASPFYGGGAGGDLMDELQLQDQLSFLNDGGSTGPVLQFGPKCDLFYPDVAGDCRSPSSNGESALFPYSVGWGAAPAGGGHHRRSCSAADLYLSPDLTGFGWKPCLYFARGYCKNGTSCRFVHGLPDDTAIAAMTAGNKIDAAVEQQCQEFLLRSKSPRQLMASAFPYSPTGSMPASPSGANKCMSFLLQQQNESQRAAVAAATAALMLGGDESYKFLGRSRMMERSDFAAAMSNPGSRQIYLTFPADSTFREEDVSNYFSIYGPVQDVRIPYQQKRMFGFVTFVYPETVKLILAKGNPHFVCDARVLVKPYKEKGKVSDKYRNKTQQQGERGDFSGCSTPTCLDSRDPFDLPQQLGPRMLYNNSIGQEALLKRKLEEQQQAAQLQHAIELQNRRFMGLQLLDIKNRNQFNSTTTTTSISSPTVTIALHDGSNGQEDKSSNPATVAPSIAAVAVPAVVAALTEPQLKLSHQSAVNAAAAAAAAAAPAAGDKEESCAGETAPVEDSSFQDSSLEHNLPDSPFASPTKATSSLLSVSFSPVLHTDESLVVPAAAASPGGNGPGGHLVSSTLFPVTSTLDMASFNSCFFPMPSGTRFQSDHGAVGM